MAVQCGIVGLPNVGKSSLFNALTFAGAQAENYPFCTIEPNLGVAPLADERLRRLAQIAGSKKSVPAILRVLDIAGLVAGASKGEGLGNKFLAHIREVDGIIHVLRCFANDDIVHVAGRIDPVADAEVVELELALADLATVARAKERASKLARSGDKKARVDQELYAQVIAQLDAGKPVRALELDKPQHRQLKEMGLLTLKPILYCANVADSDGQQVGDAYMRAAEHAAATGAQIVRVSAGLEAELGGMAEEERAELLGELGQQDSGLARVARAAYALLDLQTFFTAGPKEARAWEFRRGSLAPEAAGLVHTDMERGFIRAETISYEDYVAHNGEAGCKAAGKLRLEGRSYVVQDGDVMLFRFNV